MVQARILGRQDDIDRLISRAEADGSCLESSTHGLFQGFQEESKVDGSLGVQACMAVDAVMFSARGFTAGARHSMRRPGALPTARGHRLARSALCQPKSPACALPTAPAAVPEQIAAMAAMAQGFCGLRGCRRETALAILLAHRSASLTTRLRSRRVYALLPSLRSLAATQPVDAAVGARCCNAHPAMQQPALVYLRRAASTARLHIPRRGHLELPLASGTELGPTITPLRQIRRRGRDIARPPLATDLSQCMPAINGFRNTTRETVRFEDSCCVRFERCILSAPLLPLPAQCPCPQQTT